MAPTPIVALAMAAVLSVSVARATEYTLYAQLCLRGAGADGLMSDCGATALLSTPAGWQGGGGAVVLLAAGSAGNVGRGPLIAALLEAHTAVLELHSGLDDSWDATALVRALAALRRDAGAGTVVAIGYGDAARGALDAVAETEPARRAGGAHFAGAAALDDGTARFVRSIGEPLPSIPLGVVCTAIAAAEGRLRAGVGEACFHAMAGRGLTKAALHR